MYVKIALWKENILALIVGNRVVGSRITVGVVPISTGKAILTVNGRGKHFAFVLIVVKKYLQELTAVVLAL